MGDERFRDVNPPSDTEHEKPVREQLQKASISQEAMTMAEVASRSEEQQGLHLEENGVDEGIVERTPSPHRKRSFEEVEEEGAERDRSSRPTRQLSRKRSRDSTVEEDELNNGQRKSSSERARDGDEGADEANGAVSESTSNTKAATPEPLPDQRNETLCEIVGSPKIKRSRLHSTTLETEDAIRDALPPEKDSSDSTAPTQSLTCESNNETTTTTKPSMTGGFFNTSESSPFASVPGSKSPPTENGQRSPFATSGFGALSGSSVSGFATLGQNVGGFGTGTNFGKGGRESSRDKKLASDSAPSILESDKEEAIPSTTFGGSLGKRSAFTSASTTNESSGFGSASGFGSKFGQGGGFGGGLSSSGSGGIGFGGFGTGKGLTSFASGKPSILGGGSGLKSAKPFGTLADDDEEDDEEDGGEGGSDEAGFRSPLSQESDKQDERFYSQELVTGEEDERTEYSCRAKLYNFATVADGRKEWKERGLGVVRLNVKKASIAASEIGDDDVDAKPRARLLMRADGSHRVILNTAVRKEIRFGAPDGTEPKNGFIYFMGAVDGKGTLELLQLKVRQLFAEELYDHVSDLQAAM